MSEQSLKSRTVKGASWSFVDSIAGQGITFLVGLVLARLLSPEEYGLIGIITVFITVFNSIVDSGFSNALIRKNNAKEIDYNTVFITNLILSVVLFAILFFSAPAISLFFNQPQLIPLLRVMGSIVIINAFAIIHRTILVKKVDFKTQTKVSLISSIFSGGVGIVMAVCGFGVWSLVWQQISRQFLNSLFLWIFSKWCPKLQFSGKSFKELFSFGWKILVSGLIDTTWCEIYQIIIGKFYAPAILGQYTRAQQFASLCSSNLTSVVRRVSYPVLSSVQDNKERLKNGYQKIIKVAMLVTFTLILGLAAVSKSLILTLIGEQWLPCVPFLQILCFQMMLYPLHTLNLNMLQVQGRSDLFLKLEIIKKIIATGPLMLGIFVNIYWMLGGSVITGFMEKLFDKEFIDKLFAEAAESSRLRQNHDLRNSSDDTSQRMLNALMPDTVVPIHQHAETAETVICLCGKLEEILYEREEVAKENGTSEVSFLETARYMLCPEQGAYGMQIPAGVWHTVNVIEPSVIFEAKDGAYVPAK